MKIPMNQISVATHWMQDGNKTAYLQLFLKSLATELFIIVCNGSLQSYLFLLAGVL